MHSLFACLFYGTEWNLCSASLGAVNCVTSIGAMIKDVTNLWHTIYEASISHSALTSSSLRPPPTLLCLHCPSSQFMRPFLMCLFRFVVPSDRWRAPELEKSVTACLSSSLRHLLQLLSCNFLMMLSGRSCSCFFLCVCVRLQIPTFMSLKPS